MKNKFPRVGVGAVILDSNENILLQLRNYPPEAGFWSIPGGGVEYMEKVKDAITRELKEELGIEVIVEELLCVTDHIVPADQAHWVSPAFLVRVIKGQPKNLEPNITKQINWFPLNELPEKVTITTLSAINAYMKKYNCK